ncbi:unnamed protein product [Didymodactylos carnosus]|uniref:Uncharacterized protein n=1 Tax=Didymodactylos carnosus TaxID=1234261 RepID=A0A8S2F4G6_9BILA|nr:unnamed protein product [Didymodactylos carnosus]CAF4151561.1 unnamed protein product [Didymodactylos carnosus]
MNLSRSNATLDDKEKCLDDQQRELETLNHILSKLQIDYERSKTDLSLAHDNIVQYETNEHTIKQTLTEKTDELTTLSNRFHALQNDYYTYEKNHRYTNENYFDKEHRLTSVENELTTTAKNFELLQNENKILNDKLEKYRYDREQAEILEAENTEKVMIQSIDEGKICKRKLAILGECFQTLVRKSSETSEKWAKAIQRLHDQFSDINEQLIKLRLIEERFEQTIKIITVLRSHYEDISLQTVALKPVIEKLYMYIREYKKRSTNTNEENRLYKSETKKLRTKLDDFHRAEVLMHNRLDEQELSLIQLRKELNIELQANSDAQQNIEILKNSCEDTNRERDQAVKEINNMTKKVGNNE